MSAEYSKSLKDEMRAERRRQIWGEITATIAALYLLGCLLVVAAVIAFCAYFGVVIVLWLTEPSLNGTY